MSDETDNLVERLRNKLERVSCGVFDDRIRPDRLCAEAAVTIEGHQKEIQRLRDQLRDAHATADECACGLGEAESSNANLFAIIADIREASGLGARPMLGELAAEIGKMREEVGRAQAGEVALQSWLEEEHERAENAERERDTLRAQIGAMRHEVNRAQAGEEALNAWLMENRKHAKAVARERDDARGEIAKLSEIKDLWDRADAASGYHPQGPIVALDERAQKAEQVVTDLLADAAKMRAVEESARVARGGHFRDGDAMSTMATSLDALDGEAAK